MFPFIKEYLSLQKTSLQALEKNGDFENVKSVELLNNYDLIWSTEKEKEV